MSQMLKQVQSVLHIDTRGPGLYEITGRVDNWFRTVAPGEGQLTLFLRHTSASLMIQENADPDVQADLAEFFRRLVPEGQDWIRHRTEGPDDMPAHIKSALTATSLSIPYANGRLLLGTWQGIYLFEHRQRPHRRDLVMQVIGT